MICPQLLEFGLLGTRIDHVSLFTGHFRWIFQGARRTNGKLYSPFHFLAFENRAKCTRTTTAIHCGWFCANPVRCQQEVQYTPILPLSAVPFHVLAKLSWDKDLLVCVVTFVHVWVEIFSLLLHIVIYLGHSRVRSQRKLLESHLGRALFHRPGEPH